MNASELTTFKRQRAAHAYQVDIQTAKAKNPALNLFLQPPQQPQTTQTPIDAIQGGSPLVQNTVIFEPAFSVPIPGEFHLDDLLLWVTLEQLSFCATQNMGPTKGSRLNYIFMVSLAQAYNWVRPILTGTIDNWSWDTHSPIPLFTDQEVYVFTLHALVDMLPVLIPNFNVGSLLALERVQMNWSYDQQNAYVFDIQSKTNYAAWLSAWNTWYAVRDNDRQVAAAAQPASLPNGATILDPHYKQNFQDPTTYPNNTQWTPLLVKSTVQKYTTFAWSTVSSSSLTPTQDLSLTTTGDAAYPANRSEEITQLVSTVTQLQDIHKVQAELWAGGPNTTSPPGFYIYLWYHYAKSSQFARTRGVKALLLSGLELATNLFEVGRIAWGLKQKHLQSRPIQDIRNFYANSTIRGYDGSTISGALWLPYQTEDFITPPFADYPSGHSAFGRVFANVMTAWFGASIPSTAAIAYPRMNQILSPIFSSDEVKPPGQFVIKAGSSQIQPNVVPAADTTLTFTTWADMATSSGYSRQYGGIHAMSAHTGSVALADALVPMMSTTWKFRSP